MEIVDYTEKSFVLCGDTKIHKNILMEMGGKWNPNLKVGAGWIFSNKKKDCVLEWINTIEKSPQVISNSSTRLSIIKNISIIINMFLRKSL